MDRETVALATMLGAMLAGVVALAAPWFVMRRSRRDAAFTAAGLAAVCTILAYVSAVYMPVKYDIRVDLLVNGALVLFAWLQFFVLAFFAILDWLSWR